MSISSDFLITTADAFVEFI